MAEDKKAQSTAKAVLTDIQFWIPTIVLIAGIVILFFVSVNR